ncbi:MAG: AAA family ATPase [Chloroflexi bacterium]|nr:AAA family ATPase [Chloroflexota bacterium]
MPLIETQRTILAICLDRNEYIPIVLENLDRNYFEGDNQLIFDTIVDLAQTGMDCKWATCRDHVGGKVHSSIWQSLADSTRGLHFSGAEPFLKENIKILKAEYAQRRTIAVINSVVTKPFIDEDDIDHLGKIINQAKLVGRPKEEPDMSTAMSEYQKHIRTVTSQITTGFPSFDSRIDGFNPGELVTILARAGVGKTFAALNIINHLAGKVPFKIALFSLEMPKSAIIERMLEVYFGFSRHEVRDRSLDGSLYLTDFEERFSKLSIYDKIYSVSEIRKIVEREGYRVVFVDFLHLVRSEVIGNPYQQISQVVADLKRMAKDTGSVSFLLHQLSRQAGSGWTKVEAAHARDSGQIEELSDFLFGIWAPGLDPAAPAEAENDLSIRLIKNKRGERWTASCQFEKHSGRIGEVAKEISDGQHRSTGQVGNRDFSERSHGDASGD